MSEANFTGQLPVTNEISFTGPLNMFYVYLLQCQNDKGWYVGMTSNLKQRIKEHESGRGGRTTKLKKNWKFIYFEGYLDKQDATGRERFLKSGSGRKYLKKQLTHYLS